MKQTLIALLLVLISNSAINSTKILFDKGDQINLKGKDCAVNSPDSNVYYIGTDDKVYFYDEEKAKSHMLKDASVDGGSILSSGEGIGVDRYNTAYICGKDKKIWRFRPSGKYSYIGKWEKISDKCCLDIDVGDEGTVGITECGTQHIFQYDPTKNQFFSLNGWGAKVAMGPDGSYWHINAHRNFFRKYKNTNHMHNCNNCLKDVSIDSWGHSWGILNDNQIYRARNVWKDWDLHFFGNYKKLGVGTYKICAISNTNSALTIFRV